MPITPYRPEFPYKGNQVMISSGRVQLHSKDDSIFLFGKRGVGISTNGILGVDAKEGVTLSAPIIELGVEAKNPAYGQPIIKGNDFITQFSRLLQALDGLALALSNLKSETVGIAASVPFIVSQATLLQSLIKSLTIQLPTVLSTTTYTR